MQAIETKKLAPTNCKGARIKATCGRATIIVPYAYEATCPHIDAAQILVEKFLAEDEKQGQPRSTNPWGGPRVTGFTREGCVHIFTEPAAEPELGPNTVQLTFADDKDKRSFIDWATGPYARLLCSAVKRATLKASK
jgi:hypothetical protein